MAEDDKTKGTAQSGSDPEKDTAKEGAGPSKEEGKTQQPSADEKLPFDQHPKWKAARQAEKKLQDLQEAFGAESPEDLRDLIEAGHKIKGKTVDLDTLDEIIEKAAKLDEYEEYWKEQAEHKRRDEETPEQTIQRLEKENKDLKSQEAAKKKAAEQEAEGKRLWDDYDRTCKRDVDGMDDLPDKERKAVLLLLGVDSAASKVDFRSKEEIRKTVKAMRKTWDDLKQTIIDDYIASKDKNPKVPSGAATDQGPAPIKNLREARARLGEALSKLP